MAVDDFYAVDQGQTLTVDQGDVPGARYAATVLSAGPIAYWRLGETTGTTAQDALGAHDGVYRSGVALGQPGALSGDPDTAAGFDDGGNYVEIDHSNEFLLGSGTVMFWFRVDSTSASYGLLSKDSSGFDTGGHLTITAGGGNVSVRFQSQNDSYYVQGPGVVADEWTHAAFVFGPAGMQLLINGQLVDDDPYGGGMGVTSGGTGNFEPIVLGASTISSANQSATPLSEQLEGRLDEVAWFDRAVSAGQISDLYQAGAGQGEAQTLIPVGADWRYLDDGSNQGAAWRELGFADTAWDIGPAELGYGDGDEATTIESGPTNDKYITSYFRHDFVVDDAEAVSNLAIRSLHDDGVVVYLNGHEIVRDNMPTGAIDYLSHALSGFVPEGQFLSFDREPTWLVDGENVVAVEVHQVSGTSSDVSFDFELKATVVADAGVLGNDSDADADPLTALLVDAPAHGTLDMADDGTFTYTPELAFTGIDTFTYRASDGGAQSGLATVTIDVVDVNVAPQAVADTYPTIEDQPLVLDADGGVLANDTDVDNDTLTAALVAGPAHGQLSLDPDGAFSYTPDDDFHGADQFTYRADDGLAASPATTVTIEVAPVNDPPTAVGDAYRVNQGGSLVTGAASGVLFNDVDVDGDVLAAAAIGLPTRGTLDFAVDGSFTYTPQPDFVGTDTFTYQAADAALPSNLATVTVVINTAPTPAADAYQAVEDTPLTIDAAAGVLGNDTDPQDDGLVAALVDAPAHGSVQLATDGSFVYTPDADYFGPDGFTYAANDGLLVSSPVVVSLSVAAVNDPPRTNVDAYATPEDTPLVVDGLGGVLANDTDVDDTVIETALATAPANGTVSLAVDGGFIYSPDEDFVGADTFTYRAGDGNGSSSPTTVTIDVTPVNDPPTGQNDVYRIGLNEPLLAVAGGGPGAAATLLPRGATWRYHDNIVDGAAYPSDAQSDLWTEADFDDSAWPAGPALFGFGGIGYGPLATTVADHDQTTYLFRSTFQVDHPAAVQALQFEALVDDGAAFYINGTEVARHNLPGTVGDGTLRTDTWADVGNEDSFETVAVGAALLDGLLIDGTNTIAVELHQTSPTSSDVGLDVELIATVSENPGVLDNDNDVDGDALSAVLVADAAHGTLSLIADGSFDYQPEVQFSGVDTFTYRAGDGLLQSDEVTVSILVAHVDDPPVALADTYGVAEDGSLTIDAANGVLDNDSDPEQQPLTAALTDDVSHGTLELRPDGSFDYTPTADFSGDDTFRYVAHDSLQGSTPATVTIQVAPINDRPIAVDDLYTIDEGETLAAGGGGDPGMLAPVVVIPAGATWQYRDDIANGQAYPSDAQGDTWTSPLYDDAAWPSGDALFGFGTIDGGTIVTTLAADNQATYLFRSTFSLEDAALVERLDFGLLADDGAALFVNGVEVLRHNLPGQVGDGALTTDLWTGQTGNETDYLDLPVDMSPFPGVLQDGVNTIAVELHQANSTSSDIGFDLQLTAQMNLVPGVTANDFDADGDNLTAVLIDPPISGDFTFNDDGSFTYTPDGEFAGVEQFTYRVDDGALQSDPATVSILVAVVNDPPVANDDGYAMLEDGVHFVVAPGVLANDSDEEQEPLSAVLAAPAQYGLVELNADGSFSYTPEADFHGQDSFAYRAHDGLVGSAPAAVTITVAPLNDAPTAVDDAYVAPADGTLTIAANGVLANDDDIDGDTITAVLIDDATLGQLQLNADGSFSYTPTPAFTGQDSFTYVADDGSVPSPPATVTILIDYAPTAGDDAYTTAEDTPLTIAAVDGVLDNDGDDDGDPITAVLTSPPSHGQVDLAPDGSFQYTPQADFFGGDTFTYRARDADQFSEPATVTITVGAVNDPPQSSDDQYLVRQDELLAVAAAEGVLSNDLDVDGPSLSAAQLGPAGHGTLTLLPDGSFTYQPDPGFVGIDSFTYVADDSLATSASATVEIVVFAPTSDVVINEIMYHPASDDAAEEFIELLNAGNTPVSLAGWQFVDGINFALPAAVLQPGEFLVVAADLAAFAARYPGVTNVAGPWSGRLSDRTERIELEDAFGDRVDRVTYADEGDWSTRHSVGDVGWVWTDEHDGGGRSLELINPALSNRRGANWRASTVHGGTPGAANTVAAADVAPLIWDVAHTPIVPTSGDPVIVTAKIADELETGVDPRVRYRMSVDNPGAFQSTPMFDDGLHGDGDAADGLFGAVLPPQPHDTVIEFYVEASDDGELNRTWPAPTDAGLQVTNAAYQVDNDAPPTDQPYYRLVLTDEELGDLEYLENSNPYGNAQVSATFVATVDGVTQVRHNVGVRIRGAGSRGRDPKNFRINIPNDRVWNDVRALNVNAQFPFNQLTAMTLFEAAGLPAESPTAVRLRVNGQDRADTGHDMYGSHVYLEVPGSEWADNHYPHDAGGNFYRGASATLLYRGESADSYRGRYDKETNVGEDDWTDIIAMTRALDDGETPDNVFVETVEQVVNVQQWLRFFAVNALLVNEENGLINGNGDDYSLYRGMVDPRFVLVPHDMDTIFDQGDSGGSASRDLFEVANNPQLARIVNHPLYQPYYYAHLKQLAETVFSAAQLNPLLDQILGGWVSASVIQDMKGFAAQRVNYVMSQLPPDVPELNLASQYLRVTELMYNPRDPDPGELDVDNDLFEFIELYNAGPVTLDLADVEMIDAVSFRFAGSGLTTIGAGQYVVIAKDPAAFASRYGTTANLVGPYDGKLSNGGETLQLISAGGIPVLHVSYDDGGPWPGRADGTGSSLEIVDTEGDPLDPANWRASAQLDGSPGAAASTPFTDVVVNEVLTRTSPPDVDAIELHNTTGSPVDVGHWYVSDNRDNFRKYQIPPDTFIPAGGFLVLTEDDFNPNGSWNPNAGVPGPNEFALSGSDGDDVWLLTGSSTGGRAERFADHVEFGAAGVGMSLGRWPDGGGPLFPTQQPSLGDPNSGPRVGEVLISELMYHPTDPTPAELAIEPTLLDDDLEFVELFGRRGIVELSGWQLSQAVGYLFPPGAELAAGQTLLVVSFDPDDPADAGRLAAFLSRYQPPGDAVIVGPFSGKLDNGGESVRLLRPDEPPAGGPPIAPMILIDELLYDDVAPWPTSPDGGGTSLTRTLGDAYGNFATSWLAAAPTAGLSSLIASASVTGRYLFYNNSAWDADLQGGHTADDAAIAVDKTPLLPGQIASAANYSSFDRGITGVMIDVEHTVDLFAIWPDHLGLRIGNDSDPSAWSDAPSPTSIALTPSGGSDGADRITVRWADDVLRNQWLQVTLRAGEVTGLESDDVFYFGNAVGETGNATANALVTAADVVAVRDHPRGPANRAAIDDPHDVNRDRLVDAVDTLLVRNATTGPFNALRLIDLTPPAGVTGAYVVYPSGDIAVDKTPLLPGGAATYANYTNYTGGLTAVAVDFVELPNVLSAADFEFRTGNHTTPAGWSLAPSPSSIDTLFGQGVDGADRVIVRWPEASIRNQWLQIVVQPTSSTGLHDETTFYFGNAVGETGNTATNAMVTAADVVAVRDHPRGAASRASATDRFDINRDLLVDALDVLLARNAVTSPFNALRLITP